MLYHTFSKLNGKCHTKIKSKKAERETEIKLETCFSRTEVNFVSNVDVLVRHKFWNALNNKNCLCQTIFALVLCDSTKINLVYFILCSIISRKKVEIPFSKNTNWTTFRAVFFRSWNLWNLQLIAIIPSHETIWSLRCFCSDNQWNLKFS